MSNISDDGKLQFLLDIYNKDREEELAEWDKLHNIFTTFMLLFLGATNVFIQLENPTMTKWYVFALSVLVASILYWHLHNGMMARILDAAKIKEGREILLKVLLNDTRVYDYRDNLVESDKSVDELQRRIDSIAYPFLAFHDIIKIKLTFQGEDNKKYIVTATGFVVILLTWSYCYFQ